MSTIQPEIDRKIRRCPEAIRLAFQSEYWTWAAMKDRCLNPRCKDFHHYGARGITVCGRWRKSFLFFLHDMGPRPEGKELDRIDNDGHYQPDNCKWSTHIEQTNNQRSNHAIEWRGEIHTVNAWARILNVNKDTLYQRLIVRKWPVEKAMTLKPKARLRYS